MNDKQSQELPPKVYEFLCRLDEDELKFLARVIRMGLGGAHAGKLLIWLLGAPFAVLGLLWGAAQAITGLGQFFKGFLK